MTSSVQFKGSELIAKRWAKALMDLAREDGGISKDAILANLKDINENIASSKELAETLINPVVSEEEKQVVLEKLFKTRVIPTVFNFLTVLNSKGRLGLLEAITDEFQKELEEWENSQTDEKREELMALENEILHIIEKTKKGEQVTL